MFQQHFVTRLRTDLQTLFVTFTYLWKLRECDGASNDTDIKGLKDRLGLLISIDPMMVVTCVCHVYGSTEADPRISVGVLTLYFPKFPPPPKKKN